MNKKLVVLVVLAFTVLASGCQRIETGEVGLRRGFDKQIEKVELEPGSFNQEIVGDVLVFPVKQIALNEDKLQPMTADHSVLRELDFTAIYNINPAAVGELYTTRSHALNAIDSNGDTLLMYNYMRTIANSAAFKAVNKVNALDVPNSRSQIEHDTLMIMRQALVDDGLSNSITIDQVQIKNVTLNQSIIDSAQSVINAQNALKAKQIEVEIASKEAERLAMLSKNTANISYMHAKALSDIAEGVREGKVRSIIIPMDFKGIINAN